MLVYALRPLLLRTCPVCPCSIQTEAFLYSCFSLRISSSRKHSDHPCISPFLSPLLSTPSSTKTLRTSYHTNCITYLTLSIIMQAFWREELFNIHLCIPGAWFDSWHSLNWCSLTPKQFLKTHIQMNTFFSFPLITLLFCSQNMGLGADLVCWLQRLRSRSDSNCRWLIQHRPKGQGGPIQTRKNKCHALLALPVMSVPYICSPSLSVSIH